MSKNIDNPPTRETESASHAAGRRFVVTVTLLVVLATTLPYVYEGALAHGRWFSGAQWSPVDYRWYLVYLGMVYDGYIRDAHLYHGGAILGVVINPLFLVIGWVGKALHLSLPTAYNVGRIAMCVWFVSACWWFIKLVVVEPKAQRLALMFVCFGSGLGWLPPVSPSLISIDLWQPEAVTFLTLYLYPHFIFANIMLLTFWGYFLKAERDGSWKNVLLSGLSGLALTFVHAYDIVSVAIVMAAYLVIRLISGSTMTDMRASLGRALAAGGCALPAVVYFVTLWKATEARHTPVTTTTSSPSFIAVADGYGLLLLLAIIAVAVGVAGIRRGTDIDAPDTSIRQFLDSRALVMLSAWVMGTLVAIYIPIAFQRKMIEGVHMPIAILAAAGASHLLRRYLPSASKFALGIPELILVAIMSLSVVKVLVINISHNVHDALRGNRVYLTRGEGDALEWLHKNSPATATVQPVPWVAADAGEHLNVSDITLLLYSPALSVRSVDFGQFDDVDNSKKTHAFLNATTGMLNSDAKRRALLARPIDYIVFSQKHDKSGVADAVFPCFTNRAPIPAYLQKVYGNDDADVYRIVRP